MTGWPEESVMRRRLRRELDREKEVAERIERRAGESFEAWHTEIQRKSVRIWAWLYFSVIIAIPATLFVVGPLFAYLGNPNGWFLTIPMLVIIVGFWIWEWWMAPPKKECPTCAGTGKVNAK